MELHPQPRSAGDPPPALVVAEIEGDARLAPGGPLSSRSRSFNVPGLVGVVRTRPFDRDTETRYAMSFKLRVALTPCGVAEAVEDLPALIARVVAAFSRRSFEDVRVTSVRILGPEEIRRILAEGNDP